MNPDVRLLDPAAGVIWWQVAIAVAVGIAAGLASGFLAVTLENIEKLEAEENEERAEYERDSAAKVSAAKKKGEDAPAVAPWAAERYGWTWFEKFFSPVVTAVLFGLFTFHQGVGRLLILHLLWVAVFVHIVGFDMKHRLILNKITYPSVVVALVLSFVTPGLGLVPALIGAVICWAFFGVQSLATRGGIGQGDAKLGAVIGATCGLNFSSLTPPGFNALYAIVYGVFAGGAVAIFLLVTRRRGLRDPIPYGPFLCAGAAFVLYTAF